MDDRKIKIKRGALKFKTPKKYVTNYYLNIFNSRTYLANQHEPNTN
jgi:hypothetical protein